MSGRTSCVFVELLIALNIYGCGSSRSPVVITANAAEDEPAADPASADPAAANSTSEDGIAVLEDFIRRNPSSRYTQDARFRLATAYFERERARYTAGLEEPGARLDGFVEHADSIRVWQEYLAVEGTLAPTANQRAIAVYMLGLSLDESQRTAEALTAWRSIVCPEWHRSNDYQHCQPIDTGSVAGDIWMQLGTRHFQNRELALATECFERGLRVGREEVRGYALYMLAWGHFQQGHHQQALDHFARVLDASGQAILARDSIAYSGQILADQHWEQESRPDQTSVVSRCRSYAAAHLNVALMPAVILATVGVLIGEVRSDEANAVLAITEDYPGRFDLVEVERLRQEIFLRTP